MTLKEMIETVTYNELLDAFAQGYGTRFEYFEAFNEVYDDLVKAAKTHELKPQKHHIAIVDSREYGVAFAIVAGDKKMPFLIGPPEKLLAMEVELRSEKRRDMTASEQLLLIILSRACFFVKGRETVRPDKYIRMHVDFKDDAED